jgi:predicted pyridoxine 5'-phosphate oxidase superfamily flavin-nucleotide-binding protein
MAPKTEFASDVAFTDSVKRIQRERGSRNSYARMEQTRGGFATAITPEIAAFILVFLATASAQGQPYVQHRGGPAGFIKVLDEHTLAFADFTGNRQYITTGNLAENDRAFLFLLHYAEGERIKIWGRARVVTGDPELFAQVTDPTYDARVEQAIVFDVTAWDANCSQHIPRLLSVDQVQELIAGLQQRIRDLEAAVRDGGL